MRSANRMVRSVVAMVCAVVLHSIAAAATAAEQADPVATLRDQVATQQALLREQASLLARQQEAMADLSARLEAVSRRVGQLEGPATEPRPAPQVPAPAAAAAPERPSDPRDGVGDLNRDAVQAGSFAGAILLPGTEGVSLAMGGFVKTVAIDDSAAETMGADMLPATLGTTSPDTDGSFAIDSTITRLFLDGRARTGAGTVRGYVEYDLNATNNGALGFKLRHAYGTWETKAGTLTAGHTWSTAMDLAILPEGLTEPTLSGPVFQRQAQLRWSFPKAGGVRAHLAAEDPSGTDIFTGETPAVRTSWPDLIGALDVDGERAHAGLRGVVRRFDFRADEQGVDRSLTGWGMAVSGRVAVFANDAIGATATFGDGLGRYVLGLSRGAGAVVTPDGEILRRNSGSGMVWYRHRWAPTLRSTAGFGYARSEVFDAQPGDAFRSSTYAYGNLMWSAMRFATFGAEYSFGRRSTKDGSHLDNHRVMLGVQVF